VGRRDSEIERIKNVYKNYQEKGITQMRWNDQNPGNLMILQERNTRLLELLFKYGFHEFGSLKIMEIGCGTGDVLAEFLKWGSNPNHLFGVDLLKDRIKQAKAKHPDIHFSLQNAEELEFPSNYFDLVLTFTVFTSILDTGMAYRVASEIKRVLKPGGALVWYDFRFNNPYNPNVHGMRKSDIKYLFPQFKHHFYRITLLPPLARRLGRFTKTLYPILVKIPFLRTHYIAILIKNGN